MTFVRIPRSKRYRLALSNKSGDNHPVHLHRHTFEITKVGEKATAGVMKDTVNMTRFSTVEFDFVADDPGPALLHCHHQDHQDEGFMGLVTSSPSFDSLDDPQQAQLSGAGITTRSRSR